MILSLNAFQIANALKTEGTETASADLVMRDCEILFRVRIMPQ